MYNVSQNYIDALSEKVYDDSIEGSIVFRDGESISVSDDNLVKNTLKITKELCGSEYRIGSFNLACLKMAVFDESAMGRDYSNAVITLNYCLKFKEGGSEKIPLGIFIADGSVTSRKRDKVYITAYDKGMYFDCEPSAAIRGMTGTAPEIIEAVCEECGVELGFIHEGLPNSLVTVSLSDKQIQTCRDIVMWCAALMCGYAVINRNGLLNIISPKYSVSETDSTVISTVRSIGPKERNSIYSTDTRAYIKYLTAYSAGSVKQYTSDYVASDVQAAPASYAMASNPLLSGKSETECDDINREWHKYIERFKQRGVTARIFGDPAIDVGDAVSFYGGDIDQRGSVIGVVTSYEWKYRNYHDIYCSAAECGEKVSANSETPSSKVRNQTEKRIDAISSSGNSPSLSPSSLLSSVSFEKNCLYYNGETYHLQFGINKRIICVTKGNKYALIKSMGYTESRIEAATAVMSGLTEDWDLEFDVYAYNGLNFDIISSILPEYSGSMTCDWGDGTVNTETSHSYTIGEVVRVKVKLNGEASALKIRRDTKLNYLQEISGKSVGGLFHIGGKIETVNLVSESDCTTPVSFGENVKYLIGGAGLTGGPTKVPTGYELGIPPNVVTIEEDYYMYSASEYIYIPKSCTSIGQLAFYYNAASEIEIEEEGDSILLYPNCFGNTTSFYGGYNRIDYLTIPARAVFAPYNTPFENCGIKVVKFTGNRTEIPSHFIFNGGNDMSFSNTDDTYYIFIPKSVTSIGNFLIYGAKNRAVHIICEGNWSDITKSDNWDGEYGARQNVGITSDQYTYNNTLNNIIKRNL